MSTTSELDRFLPRQSSLDPAYRAINDTAAFICSLFVALLKVVTPHIFTILSFGSFVIGAFMFSTITGFLVLGLALLLFEARVSDSR